MKTDFLGKPRAFHIGEITIHDQGKVQLEPDELISFKQSNDKEMDVVAKSWGFYATPSMNGRLKQEGFKTALVRNETRRFFIMVVDIDKMDNFLNYLKDEKQTLVEWLDERE